MRTTILFLFAFLQTLFSSLAFPQTQAIDSLQNSEAGEFPRNWKTYPFQMGKAKKVYAIQEEKGEKFIRAVDDQEISTPIFKDFHWELGRQPLLQWKWRATKLPSGAREDHRSTNDSACGVYVAFGRTSGVVLKYVWSSTLPVGHVWEKDPGKFFIVVADSGSSSINRWKSHQINVLEDYKKYFKKEPSKNPSGIGIMTDGNAVHQPAGCDYSNFALSSP